MRWWRHKVGAALETPVEAVGRVRAKYVTFRGLLTANNESLELMAGLQEDLQYVPPRRDVLGDRIAVIFGRIGEVVTALEQLTGMRHAALTSALQAQQLEIERYAAALEELRRPRLSAWLSEVNAASEEDVGSKASMLGEIRNKLGLPVPDGFVLTTEAYRQVCGIPIWQEIRDATRDLDLNDLEAVGRASEGLTAKALECPLPRAVEVAITGRTDALLKHGGALAVRSSAKGEGGAKSYAGQFLSLLNVPREKSLDAYRRVIAARFAERALYYRLSNGLLEVDNPMAVLFLPVISARASGIMYTRDPNDAKCPHVWITSTRGLGLEIASGRIPADLFLVTRSRPHTVAQRNIVHKEASLVLEEGEGVASVPVPPGAQDAPSLQEGTLHTLAEWAVRLEDYFHAPQDVEWVLGEDSRLWVVQSRPLASADAAHVKPRSRPKAGPRLEGGRTIYPGQTSGPAFLADDIPSIAKAPSGSVVFIRKPSPEIVEIFPRIAGLVAEWGNVTGHAAALLREFQIPSVFLMPGVFEKLSDGEPVSLDAVGSRIYSGILWPASRREQALPERYAQRKGDPIAQRLLTLTLLDPSAHNFRPAGCQSGHDVLRYCHEKAIEAMFEINDYALEHGMKTARKLSTALPLNFLVMDLGGGFEAGENASPEIAPAKIISRPFQALWKGITHPEVTWTREMPAAIGDLASVLASSLTPQSGGIRPLGDRSYLLVADEYMNLNSRLAYHYSLVDACISDNPNDNYISFRFEGGGATRQRRSLRACFLEKVLTRYGFKVDRRTDLVNAWFRKAPAEQTAERLDILGRLLACSSQLDMYMTSREVMGWYVDQFLKGNYSFLNSQASAGL